MNNTKAFFRNVMLGISFILLLSLLVALPQSYADGDPTPSVLPRDSIQFGRSCSDWTAAWWQWALSIPVAMHPLFDNGDCSVGQSGPVFFLGGKFCSVTSGAPCTAGTATRSCTVPSQKALFFPIVNVEDSLVQEELSGFPGQTIVDLRSVTAGLIDAVSDLEAEVDGHSIRDLQRSFRVQSPVFEFTLPDDNILKAIGENIAAGTYSPAVADGVYLMLPGLRPGNHVLHFKATANDLVIVDITYNLNVVNVVP